jgi:nuclear GTP-binding protein
VKVVDASDVIIQVLDARDPLACRAPEVERFVRSRGADKKLVLLLNKIDLVPKHAAEAWLGYFRGELPTVAFKCATSAGGAAASRKPLPRAGALTSGAADGLGGGSCAGADMLLGLLKNYARSRSMKTAITVGIVGLPNVGKSSLINSLTRGRAAATGATPGLTRAAQEVVLDKHVKLLDSPGIVFSTAGAPSDAAAALRNAIRVEKLEDPLPAVGEILARARPEALMAIYGIPRFAGADEFLRHVAAKRGKLRRGGVPDAPAAARIVLGDWNSGRIPFFTLPPVRENAVHDSASVVSAFGADFDVTAVRGAARVVTLAQCMCRALRGSVALTLCVCACAFSRARLFSAQMNSAVIETEGAAGVAGADADEFVQMPAGAEGGVVTGLEAMEAEVAAAPLDEHDDMEDAGPAGASEAASARLRRGKADARGQNEALYGEDAMFNPKAARAARKRAKKAGAAADAEEESDGSDFDWDGATRAARAEAAAREAGDDDDDDDDDEDDDEDGMAGEDA